MNPWGDSWGNSWENSWFIEFVTTIRKIAKMPAKYLTFPRFRNRS